MVDRRRRKSKAYGSVMESSYKPYCFSVPVSQLGLITRREGNAGARVIVARGLP